MVGIGKMSSLLRGWIALSYFPKRESYIHCTILERLTSTKIRLIINEESAIIARVDK